MKSRRLLYIALAVLFVLHQDFWNWSEPRWLLGLPIGLLHHIVLCLIVSVVMAALLRLDRREPRN